MINKILNFERKNNMITSLMFNGKYNVAFNSNKKIKVQDKILSVVDNISCIRYRLGNYTQEEVNYIKSIKDIFINSVHIVEFMLNDNLLSELTLFNTLKVAKFLRIDLTDTDIAQTALDAQKMQLLQSIIQANITIDRYVLVDKTSSINTVALSNIIKNMTSTLGLQENNIAICESPLSFSDKCCLSAV